MAFNYIGARATAKRLIGSTFGGVGSVFIPAIVGGDRNDDGTINPGVPEVNIPGIITPRIPVKTSEIDGENIQQGDFYTFFQHETQSDIEIGMFTTINGIKHRIYTKKQLSSLDDVEVLLRLTIRA